MRTTILSQCHVRHCETCVQTRENVTCEGVLFTHPLVAAVCHQLSTILLQLFFFLKKKTQIIMSSTSVHSTATMTYWKKKKTNATFGIDEKELVQVALLQIHCGDGAHLSVLLGRLIGVSSVHFCLICSVRFTSFS